MMASGEERDTSCDRTSIYAFIVVGWLCYAWGWEASTRESWYFTAAVREMVAGTCVGGGAVQLFLFCEYLKERAGAV